MQYMIKGLCIFKWRRNWHISFVIQATADVQSWACALTIAITDYYRSNQWLCGIGIKRRSFEIIGERKDVFQDYFNKFFLVIETDNCYVTMMLNKTVTFFHHGSVKKKTSDFLTLINCILNYLFRKRCSIA